MVQYPRSINRWVCLLQTQMYLSVNIRTETVLHIWTKIFEAKTIVFLNSLNAIGRFMLTCNGARCWIIYWDRSLGSSSCYRNLGSSGCSGSLYWGHWSCFPISLHSSPSSPAATLLPSISIPLSFVSLPCLLLFWLVTSSHVRDGCCHHVCLWCLFCRPPTTCSQWGGSHDYQQQSGYC